MADIVFGRVPHPVYIDHPITKAEGHGQNNLGQRTVKGVVWHRMIGTLRGTDAYFGFPSTDALTDYGVGTAGTDGTADDGQIIRWNNPLGHQSGWASGPVNAPYGDGLAFINKYATDDPIGVNVVNRDQTSIEISGKAYLDSVSTKAKHAVAAITAYWADQYKIPWDVFPIAPQDGFSFVRWHQEFTIGTGKVCPGQVVMDATLELIEMARAILKQYQEEAVTEQTPSQYPTPVGIPDMSAGVPVLVKDVWWFPVDLQVEATKRAVPRTYASTTAPQAAPTVEVKTKKKVIAYVKTDVAWLILDDHSRILASSFTPAITMKVR